MTFAAPFGGGQTDVARHVLLRAQNLRLLTAAIFSAGEPLSRGEAAKKTGLSKSAVTGLADALIAARIVAEMPPELGGSRGRPKVGLVPADHTLLGAGLQVSSSHLGVCLMDLSGNIVREQVAPIAGGGDPVDTLSTLGQMAFEAFSDAAWEGMQVAVGRLAVPGLITTGTGELVSAPSLGWQGFDPVAALGITTPRIAAVNDSKLAALMAGYASHQTARRLETFIYVHAEVGVGGAIIVDRNVFGIGAGWNAEIGHLTVDPHGPACDCGSRGCLEQYLGRPALARALGLPPAAPAAEVRATLLSGSPVARAVAEGAGTALGIALANFIKIVGITDVVVGGDLVPLLPVMRQRVTETLEAQVLGAQFLDLTVTPSAATEHEVLRGAARSAVRQVIDNPIDWIDRAAK